MLTSKAEKKRTRLSAVLLLLFGLMLTPLSVSAQRDISGTVVDESGEPLMGAIVKLHGSNNGTTTDLDGHFRLNVPEKGTLVVNYIGYAQTDVTLNNRNTYRVVLKESVNELNDVVVLGYSIVRKKSFTGSAATVKAEDITAMKTISPTEALQGRVAGVNVTTSSGMPGAPTSIRVRGVNSINSGKDPLWIIDGVPLYSGGGLESSNSTNQQDPMSMINPNDIESMEILKDAAATAIYGSRGTNGVIIITTKSGKRQASGNITVDVTTGMSNLTRTPEDIGFASTEQWFRIADMAVQNQQQNPDALYDPAQSLSSASVPFKHITREEALATNSDWFDKALRTGHYIDINLSMVKGFDKGSVFTSFNFRNDEGVVRNNDFKKYTGRINADYEVIKNLNVGSNLAFSYSRNNRVKNGASGSIGGGGGTAGAFQSANRIALPWLPIYDDEDPTGYWSARSGNIVANNDRRYLRDYVDQYRVLGNTFAELKIAPVKGLSVRTELGVDYINNSSVDWRHALITETGESYAYDQNVNRFGLNYNAFMKYNNTFGIHSITAVAGMESMRMKQWTRSMNGRELVGIYPELGSTNPGNMLVMRSWYSGEDYLMSYFMRADYRLMDRYVFALSLRTDGSSKFDEDKRWGKFIAVSGGWLISEEPFFEGFKNVMNMLKLKASYGQTGNNSVPNNIYDTVWTNGADNRYGTMEFVSNGTVLKSIGNKSATWETTNNFDAGIDYGFFKNRISGSIDFYYKKVTDMLLRASLPSSSGITGGNSVWANVGDMANWGLDFSMNSVNFNTKQFNWTTTLNLSFNRNKVLHLTDELDKGGKGIDGNGLTKIVTNHRYGTYFMPEYAGIDSEKGVEMIWEIDRNEYEATGRTVKTGRKIPATTANMQEHQVLFGDKTNLPSWYGGLNNTFRFHNFDASIFFTFSGGNYIYDYNLKRASSFHNGQSVILADLNEKNIWSPTNPNAKYPIQSYNSNYPGAGWNAENGTWDETVSGDYNATYNHSKYLYKGDFLRLKNITLGYTLPKAISMKAYLQQLRLFVQGTNLWTLTDYPGYDPEGASYVYNPSIPNVRTWSVGLTAKF